MRHINSGLSGKEGKALIANNQDGLRQDDLFVSNSIISVQDAFKYKARKGYEKVIISNDKIVNIVSDSYGHLPNIDFFGQMENKLLENNISTLTRSFNKDDRSFKAEYILNDDKYQVSVKDIKDNNGNIIKSDLVRPLISLINSYDGSCKTTASFGYYRVVCQNGLHICKTNLGFSTKHSSNIIQIVMPELDAIINNFMSNEFFDIKKKFEVLAETPIKDMKKYVKFICKETGIFKFEKSDKNSDPSKNANDVMDIILKESKYFNAIPNLFNGYNAFNETLHKNMQKEFSKANEFDLALFDATMEYAN